MSSSSSKLKLSTIGKGEGEEKRAFIWRWFPLLPGWQKKNKCLCGVSQQGLPEVEAFRRILNILEVCGRTQVAVTGWQKEYTVQRDTEGGDKCKVKDVLFPPQPRISFYSILDKTAKFPGEKGREVPYKGNTGMFISLSPLWLWNRV